MTTPLIVTIDAPVAQDLLAKAEEAYSFATFLEVRDQEDFELASTELGTFKKTRKLLDTKRKEITKPIDDAKKDVLNIFKPAIERYDSAIDVVSKRIADYTIDVQRQKEEAEREAMLKAKALQALEEKVNQEAQAKIEEIMNDESLDPMEQFEKASEITASTDELMALKSEQEMVQAYQAQVDTKVPKVKGLSTKIRYKGEVVDKLAYVKFVAEHPEYLATIEVKEGALSKIINSLGGTVAPMGVKILEDVVITNR